MTVVVDRFGDGAPVRFVVHPGGLPVRRYRTLGVRGTLVVLSPDALTGPGVLDAEALVTQVANEVLDAHPEGPVRLVGWSLGGAVAWWVAERLLDRGRSVAPPVLLDAPARPPRHDARSLRTWACAWAAARRTPLPEAEAMEALRVAAWRAGSLRLPRLPLDAVCMDAAIRLPELDTAPWDEVAARVTRRTCPGDHYTMLGPAVGALLDDLEEAWTR
ncbi:MAG: alpha/beta hydrolase [Alphaproteobacteria bacterium]|nr:alpha/beta hydrolase [Alphaproteobacteria bacterium]